MILNEASVLDRVSDNIKKFYREFLISSGLKIKFERIDNRVRASNSYTDNSSDYIISLGEEWREVDLVHELMHGKLMFIEKYGLIFCRNPVCQLLRDYIEDIVVHDRIFTELDMIPYDPEYLIEKSQWAGDLSNGARIEDSYWDAMSVVCNHLHKALLYVQAWHFDHIIPSQECSDFLTAFRESYENEREIQLIDKITSIIRNYDYLNCKQNYDEALEEIINIDYLDLPSGNIIKHYERITGYVIS